MNDNPKVEHVKGGHGGTCNRTVCNTTGADWFNDSTKKFYCKSCAFAIMRWPENVGLLTHQPKIEVRDVSVPKVNPEWEKAPYGVWFPCLEPMPDEVADQYGLPRSKVGPLDKIERP